MNEITQAVAAGIAALKSTDLLKEIYGDLLKPGVKQVGMAVEKILLLPNIALWHIDRLNGRANIALEANLEAYRQEMAKVPDEKVAEVRPELGVPIMERLAYVGDTELSKLYIALLASASNVDTNDAAHPAFVNIINSLSPDEGRLLRPLARERRIPFVEGQFGNGDEGHITAEPFVVDALITDPLVVKANLAAYLTNLEGLGLVRAGTDRWLSSAAPYAALEASFLDSGRTPPPGGKLEVQKGVIDVTPYGQLFIRACRVLS